MTDNVYVVLLDSVGYNRIPRTTIVGVFKLYHDAEMYVALEHDDRYNHYYIREEKLL